MTADASAKSSAATPDGSPPLTIEFDTDAPVLTTGASRVLLALLLASDPEQAITNADETGPAK
ncbi:hypothetical protein [Micromonospora sp. CPCC 206061]|uniref:hypothetical protein n=1 Tax=Micromonospora sp. CPCC 206061 TaxID=3122410 RepID=UPI002FF0E2FC